MNFKFLFIVLMLVCLTFANEFYFCIEECSNILDQYDFNRETNITLTKENFCNFMYYLQKFNEYSRMIVDRDGEIGKDYIRYYNLRDEIMISCEQEYINFIPLKDNIIKEKIEL